MNRLPVYWTRRNHENGTFARFMTWLQANWAQGIFLSPVKRRVSFELPQGFPQDKLPESLGCAQNLTMKNRSISSISDPIFKTNQGYILSKNILAYWSLKIAACIINRIRKANQFLVKTHLKLLESVIFIFSKMALVLFTVRLLVCIMKDPLSIGVGIDSHRR